MGLSKGLMGPATLARAFAYRWASDVDPHSAPDGRSARRRAGDAAPDRARFFTTKNELSPAELAYLVDVDHKDHEAIIAIDPSSGEALGVARYIRSKDDAEVAEVAVTVADDWQRRGLGCARLDRLAYRARREGVRRFSALVQDDNPGALRLLADVGDTRHQWHTGVVELRPHPAFGGRLDDNGCPEVFGCLEEHGVAPARRRSSATS
jgi:GNAT superfamily N-acetyltransferase